MPPETIAEVITRLQQIVQQCKHSRSRAGYFAALYLRMTIAVQEGIQKGFFEDGKRMEKLDVIFANRYIDAYDAYAIKGKCSASWQYALDCGLNEKLTVFQQLILGINTHINLDLAIAAALTAPGKAIGALENDFNRINKVIESLTDDVQQCLEQVWMPMQWISRISNGRHEPVINFSIGIARKTAWTNATLLAGMNPLQQHQHILKMDDVVKTVASKIVNPGMRLSAVLYFIRKWEFEDVARTINLIETTVVED